jgi:hypothetical protein
MVLRGNRFYRQLGARHEFFVPIGVYNLMNSSACVWVLPKFSANREQTVIIVLPSSTSARAGLGR